MKQADDVTKFIGYRWMTLAYEREEQRNMGQTKIGLCPKLDAIMFCGQIRVLHDLRRSK